jgi:hypothetical protein
MNGNPWSPAKSADISPCGRYRYRLTRGEDPMLCFVMLNPSTADADNDDATIRRCLSFARREKCAGIKVVNLYAYRATKPAELRGVDDPFGPENWKHLERVAQAGGRIVCAWGAGAGDRHVRTCLGILRSGDADLVCLGTTAAGAPRHPLYVRGDTPLVPFR